MSPIITFGLMQSPPITLIYDIFISWRNFDNFNYFQANTGFCRMFHIDRNHLNAMFFENQNRTCIAILQQLSTHSTGCLFVCVCILVLSPHDTWFYFISLQQKPSIKEFRISEMCGACSRGLFPKLCSLNFTVMQLFLYFFFSSLAVCLPLSRSVLIHFTRKYFQKNSCKYFHYIPKKTRLPKNYLLFLMRRNTFFDQIEWIQWKHTATVIITIIPMNAFN